jgi:hypothetical protein
MIELIIDTAVKGLAEVLIDGASILGNYSISPNGEFVLVWVRDGRGFVGKLLLFKKGEFVGALEGEKPWGAYVAMSTKTANNGTFALFNRGRDDNEIRIYAFNSKLEFLLNEVLDEWPDFIELSADGKILTVKPISKIQPDIVFKLSG